jgi:YVTN family beta-propeller protein
MGGTGRILRHSAVFAAIAAIFACVAASASAAPLAWVLNPTKDSVTTFDPAANQVVGMPIQTGADPDSIAITPNGKRAFVANSTGKSVTVIETATRIPIATIPLAGPAEQIAISPDGTMAYVTTGSNEKVAVIATETNSVIRSISLGSETSAVAATPSGEFAYIGISPDEVQAINPVTGGLVGPAIEVGGRPEAIAFAPDGKTAYVAAGTEVTVIRGERVVGVLIGTAVSGLAVSPDGQRLYVTSAIAESLTTIDAATDEVVGTPLDIPGAPGEIAITASGRTGYVANGSSEELTPINLATGMPGTPLVLAGSGGQLTIAPDQPPVAAFDPPQATTGVPVTFSAAPSTDPDGSIAAYQWSLNDAASPTGLSVTHTFLNPGTYFTILTLTDDEGCSLTAVFTGRTAYCNGSGVASVTHPVSVTNPTLVCSAKFGVRRLLHNRKNGTVRLQVKLHSAGFLLLFGKKVHAVTRKVKKAGSMWLTVHARVELNKRLKKTHHARVRTRITFTPNAGCGYKTVHRSFALLRRKKHHR